MVMIASRLNVAVSAPSPGAADTTVWWVFGAGLLIVLVGLLTVKVARPGQRLVVFRFGRVVAVKGPGLMLVLPGVHRVVRVPLEPARLDLFWLEAVTKDGVAITVNATALASVRDPSAYAQATRPPRAATEDAAAVEISRYVEDRELAALSRFTAEDLTELTAGIDNRTRQWGVEVAALEFSRMEVRLEDDLLRWAEELATRQARPGPAVGDGLPYRNGGKSTVDISRTSVPGTGTLNHYTTRTGQRIGVLVPKTEGRRLFVYGSPELDIPTQTIVLEQDEADQLADVLHSRSIPDRIAALERRFADITGG